MTSASGWRERWTWIQWILVSRSRVDGVRWVDNKPIREAVERAEQTDGLSMALIAERLGWKRPDRTGIGDGSRLSRRLGRTTIDGEYTRALRYDLAVAIIRAIDRDPVDFDL